MIDLNILLLRSAVEQDALRLLSPVGEADVSGADIFALRQFLGWHRLRFGTTPDRPQLPGLLCLFIGECGRGPANVNGHPCPDGLDQQMIAAGLRTRGGAMSAGTLRRRVASISRVFAVSGELPLQENPVVVAAIRAVTDAQLREKAASRFGELTASECVRADLLATCDESLAGARDRAFLAAAFATGWSVSNLLRSDLAALARSFQDCCDQSLRDQAFDAVSRWCALSKLSEGRPFRRVRPDGRLGAPMNRTAAQQMISRRLALARAHAVAPSRPAGSGLQTAG